MLSLEEKLEGAFQQRLIFFRKQSALAFNRPLEIQTSRKVRLLKLIEIPTLPLVCRRFRIDIQY